MASLSIADNAAPTAPVRPATTSQQLSVWARGLAWARGTTTSTIDYTVAHGPDLVACAVDSCAVVGVGEDAAHRAQIAAPWFLRILSTYAPSYQMEKGITYLDEAFDMLQQNGREMPLKVSKKLLKTYNLLRQERDTLQQAKQQSRRANRLWKTRAKNLLVDVKPRGRSLELREPTGPQV